jgi:hypothetical protein
MVAILLFASAVYLTDLNHVSFWEDESWMAEAIKGDLPAVWTFAAERGLHPPLYFYVGWLYTRLTGDGELAMRWLSGLCGLIGIAWTYRLGATWFGRKAGLYAALLTAGSLFLIYFARLSRQYTLFFALAPALLWVYTRWAASLKANRTPSSAKSPANLGWFFIIVVQVALLYTHYYGIWTMLVLALYGYFTLRRRDWYWLMGALIISGLLFLPWVPAILYQLSHASRGLGYATRDLGYAIRAYLDRVFNGNYLLGAALMLLGLYALWRGRKSRSGVLLMLWLTVPLGLSLLLNLRFPWFIERNMIFTLAGMSILFGAGLAWVSQHRAGKLIAPIAAVAFVGLGLTQYETFWGDALHTPDWRGMARAIAQDSRPDDTFMIYGEPYSMTYYLSRDMNAPVRILSLDQWLEHHNKPQRIWLMDANWAVRFEAIDALPKDAVMTRRYVLGVLVTEFYQRPPSEAVTLFGGQIALGFPETTIQTHPGSSIHLDLWWRAAKQPDKDYSVGVYLVAADGRVVAQQDGGFDRGQIPAPALPQDKWTPDARTLNVPADLPAGDYTLTAAVYDWRSGERLKPDNGRADGSFPFASVQVK